MIQSFQPNTKGGKLSERSVVSNRGNPKEVSTVQIASSYTVQIWLQQPHDYKDL